MSKEVESILRDRLQAIDEAQAPVGWDEIVELLEEENVVEARPNHRLRRGLLVFAAAVLALVLLGVIPLLLRSTEETPPADTVTPTTLSVPTTTPSDLLETDLEPLPVIAPAQVVDGYEPFGPVQVEYSVTESDFLPNGTVMQHDWSTAHGGLVRTDNGYLALAQDRHRRVTLVSSGPDATEWVEVAARIDGDRDLTRSFGFRGRLFEVGGWYWIETLVPTRLYRSDGGVEWEEIRLPVPSDWSLTPVGFPLVDHRFVEFGDRLVGFSGEVLSVDVASGEVTTHPYPWEFPEDGFWFSSVVIGDELHVYVSAYLGQPEAGGPPVFEEWVTTNLTDWNGPLTPPMAFSETRAFGVVGTAPSGYLAPIETSNGPEGLYSSDGLNWQRFNPPPTTLGAGWMSEPVTPVKIGGEQGLVVFQGGVLWVSHDGHTWQRSIPPSLESRVPGAGDRVNLSVIDEKVYLYRQADGQLETWKWTFANSSD